MARDIRTKAMVFLVVLGLGGAPAWGADRQREESRLSRELRGVVTVAWHLLQNVWGKAGSSLDPFGVPTGTSSGGQTNTATSPGGGDNGSSLDPFGTR